MTKHEQEEQQESLFGRMTLRQWYAGLAMQSLISGFGSQDIAEAILRTSRKADDGVVTKTVAIMAFNQADAMIIEGGRE